MRKEKKDIFLLSEQGLLSVNIMCSCGCWMRDIPQGGTYQGDWGWFLWSLLYCTCPYRRV